MRRLFVLLVAVLVLAGCGRTAPGAPVIAVLLSDDVRLPKVEGLKAGLAGLGYAPGQVTVEIYSAKGDRAALRPLAARALSTRPAVVVAGGNIEALMLKEEAANDRTPIVMMGGASTVRAGLVTSLRQPGGNVTGLDNQHAELSAKRLELLTKLLPQTRRVLVLYDPQVVPGQHALELTRDAAAHLGVTLQALPVATLESAVSGLRAIQPGQFDAALLLPGYVLESGARQLTAEFDRLVLPVMGPLDLEGEGGLLAAYGVSMRNQGLQSARIVAKVLRGETPASIPVETPDTPELVVDLRVARRLGLTLSPVGMAFARTLGEGGRP